MANAHRIDLLPNCPFDRGERVLFTYEGRTVEGYANEPLAMALLASGARIFGRSIKYHRPRAPRCLRAHCSGCLMRVDGQPSVRTCETLCRSGQKVEHQVGWPSASRDIFRAVDWMYPHGLKHHELFTTSSMVNRLAQPFVRQLAGHGSLPSESTATALPLTRMSCPVVVVGAGIAGLSAAQSLAEKGQQVLVLEGESRFGGRLLDGANWIGGSPKEGQRGWECWKEWKATLARFKTIDLRLSTTVLAAYPLERPQLLASNPTETLLIDADRVILCTGTYEQIPLFENNDLPGIFGTRALDRLVFGYGVVPGEPLVVVGESDQTLLLALLLLERNLPLAGIVTDRRDGELVQSIRQKGGNLVANHRLMRARGGRWLGSLELISGGDSNPDLILECSACAVEAPAAPAYELAHHLGCRVAFRSASGYQVVTDPSGQTSNPRVFAAGHCASAGSPDEASRHGQEAGLGCHHSLNQEIGSGTKPQQARS